MARSFPQAPAEPLDLLRIAAQFTWRCGPDMRVESVEIIDPRCPPAVLGALRGLRLGRLAERALYPAERRALDAALADGADLADMALTLPEEAGETLRLSLSATAQHDDEGGFAGYVGIGRAGGERPYDALQRRELVELLRRAEAARDREAALRRESEAMLSGLRALYEPVPLAEKCRAILGVFAPLLDCEVAVVLRRGVNGVLSAVVATRPEHEGLVWPEEPTIGAALAGEAAVYEDLRAQMDTAPLGQAVRALARSALFAPLRIGKENAVMVALHGTPGALGQEHLAVMQRLGLIAAQAFAAEEQKAALVNASKLASLGEMLAAIAHEVNQPLSIISMSVQNARMMVEDAAPAEEVFAKLDTTEQQAHRAGEIVKAIRALAHPDRGASGAAVADIPAESLFHSLKVLCEGTLRAKGIALEVGIADPCRALRADAGALEQVLLNLIVNARDAILARRERDGDAAGEGRIGIAVEDLPGTAHVRVRVADTGGGIPADVMERIFDPFFTLKEVGKGTGLGLSISRSLLADMQASLDVRNEGEGALFEILVPAAA